MRIDWRRAAAVASVAAVLAVTLPLQTYFGNAEAFPFSLGRLLPELAGIFLLFAAGLLGIDFLLRKLADRMKLRFNAADGFLSLLVAALVCVHLESGLLSAGLPEINGGSIPALADHARWAVDGAVWGALLLGFVVFTRKIRPYLHWIALSVLILSSASLLDVCFRSGAASSAQGPQTASSLGTNSIPLVFASQPTVVANVRYSPTRNILVFVLDSMPGLATLDAVGKDEALLAKFPGFTAYPQNVGMHECTKRGVPGLVTGRHFDPADMSEGDYPMTMYGDESFVRLAERSDWSVAFSPDLLPYGATNLPIERRVDRQEKRRARDRLAILRQSTEVPNLSLFDLVAFRLTPFALKGPLLYGRIRHAVKGRHDGGGFWGEQTMYPQLAACPVNAGPRPFLGFFHSWGVHPPWARDFPTTVAGKLALLGRLMDAYRAKGLYDKSLIIVTSDHGLDGARPVGAFPPSASALLWIKPEGAAAPFAVSGRATSHAQVAALVKDALKGPLAAPACEKLLATDRRLYRAEVREGTRERFQDWTDTPAGEGK